MLGGQSGGVVVVAPRLRGQRADYVREGIVRQPGDAVVVGPARIHPVTRGVDTRRASGRPPAITLVIPDCKDGATRADRKVGLPLRLQGIGVAVQLEWGTEGLSLVGGADVEDVARITIAGVARGIDVVNHAVVASRLTPAHVPPVATAIGIHADEVGVAAAIKAAGRCEGGAGIGVSPGVTAVGGPEEEVGAGAEAAAPFVHASDVHVPCDQVTGDLDVADEGAAASDLSLVGPSQTVVSGEPDEEGTTPASKVVPGNIHPPVEGRGWVHVAPARLSVVPAAAAAAAVDAVIMGPTSRGWVPGSGRVVPAEA